MLTVTLRLHQKGLVCCGVGGSREVSYLGYTPYKLKVCVNEGVVDKELLQCIFDSLSICDIA